MIISPFDLATIALALVGIGLSWTSLKSSQELRRREGINYAIDTETKNLKGCEAAERLPADTVQYIMYIWNAGHVPIMPSDLVGCEKIEIEFVGEDSRVLNFVTTTDVMNGKLAHAGSVAQISFDFIEVGQGFALVVQEDFSSKPPSPPEVRGYIRGTGYPTKLIDFVVPHENKRARILCLAISAIWILLGSIRLAFEYAESGLSNEFFGVAFGLIPGGLFLFNFIWFWTFFRNRRARVPNFRGIQEHEW